MKQKHFCSDALCGKEITQERGYVKIGNNYWCSTTCWQMYLTQNRDFEDAVDNFKPKKHVRKKRWWE